MIEKELLKCVKCNKPYKKIDEYSYKLNCDCIKKFPKLKDLRLSVG